MNFDEYGEVINGEDTYKSICSTLINKKSIIIGWTDEEGTHFDILFTINAEQEGMLQRGLRRTDLFVSVMSIGSFGFLLSDDKDSGYVGEKLNLSNNITTRKLTELINGIITELKGHTYELLYKR